MAEKMEKERTLILLKPDTVKRALVGKILERFESVGLKIIAMKMVQVDADFASQHYFLDEEWARNVYEKTKAKYDQIGKEMKHPDHLSLGKEIQQWNMNFLQEGPVIAAILEGHHAIEIVRKLIGATEPLSASPGTIRSDFSSTESYKLCDSEQRVAKNMVHASDSIENAKREIALWFSPEELHNYKNIHDFSN